MIYKKLLEFFSQELSDRFYASFYRRLLTVKTSNHDVEFFALLEKVIMADEIKERVKAFLKRILQIALSSTAAFAGASLLMYSRVIQSKGQDLMILTIEKPVSFGFHVFFENFIFRKS